MKIRVTVEYENDALDTTLTEEETYWRDGDVDLYDIIISKSLLNVKFEEIV